MMLYDTAAAGDVRFQINNFIQKTQKTKNNKTTLCLL